MTILIVEDDPVIREGIKAYLSAFAYDIMEAKDGLMALNLFQKNKIDLVLLDIQIPLLNGLEVLKEIRQKSNLPILILTAFNDEDYKITAFSNLADGYMEKPFSLPVLKARIDALLTKHLNVMDIFCYQETEVNFKSYVAKINGQRVHVNAKEIEILKYLLQNEGHVLSRDQILTNVWKESEEIPYDRVIDVYIKELRKKLALDCIVTIRNVGYKLERR